MQVDYPKVCGEQLEKINKLQKKLSAMRAAAVEIAEMVTWDVHRAEELVNNKFEKEMEK